MIESLQEECDNMSIRIRREAFYLRNGSRDALRWDHLTEEMHRFRGGRWQNTPYRHVQ